MTLLKKVDNIVGKFLEVLCMGLLVVLFLLLILNVFFRFVPIYSMGWFDEIVELSFTSLTFYGAAYLWRARDHSRIDFLQEKFEGTKTFYVLEILIDILGLVFVCFMIKYSINLIDKTTAWSPIFKIPRKVFYACIPISSGFMAIYSIRDIIRYAMKLLKKSK